MNYDFSKKVVLVTGASAGIGEATALLLAKLGAQLAIVGRNEQNLNSVAERCRKEPGAKVLPIIADLGTDEGCEKTAKLTIDHYGRLDVLVNNAAIGGRDTILNASMELHDRLIGINLRGVYNLTRLLVPALIESKGNIINISSAASTMVSVGALTYSMTKAAIDHFTRLTALELAPKGVRVNTVNPGVTISKFYQRISGKTDEEYQEYIKGTSQIIPMREVCKPEDIAYMIVFLASDHCRLVTGTDVQVDGGIQYCDLSNMLKEQAK